MKLKSMLESKVTKKELSSIPSSFDLIGDIAIFNDIPKEVKKHEKLIAQTIMQIHPHIKVVMKKVGKFSGKLRTPKLAIIAGEKRKETVHKENGCTLKLNVETCYFSPRLSSERLRIAHLVKKGENVLVLFSGVAPYPCVLAKNASPKEIQAIELNKAAHNYAEENMQRNKLRNVILYQGNVKNVLPKLNKKFDRIIMPLPKESPTYLDSAVKKLKPKGTIHLYLFAHEDQYAFLIKEYKKKFKSVKLTPCGVYAPKISRVCLDLKN
jgi:tRNA (guanine37-N1)-methyltransferase